MIKCSKCNAEPNEKDIIGWKCNSCGKAFKVSKSKLHSILMKKAEDPEKSYISCPSCKNSLDDGNECIVWKCSCGNTNIGKLKDFEDDAEVLPKNNLIRCPECGKEISSKAKRCVHCGKNLTKKPVEKEKYICKECGNEIESPKKICPKCGCPIEKEKRRLSSATKKILLIMASAFVIVVIIAAILYCCLQDYFSYNEAMNNYNQGNFVLAAEQFSVIEEYKDASEQYKNCIYAMAKEFYEVGKLSEAAEKFETIRVFSDSEDLLKDIYYT